MVECLPSIDKTLGLIPSTKKKKDLRGSGKASPFSWPLLILTLSSPSRNLPNLPKAQPSPAAQAKMVEGRMQTR